MSNVSIKRAFELNWQQVNSKINTKADANHTHNYAGSSSAGGAATSANKLNTNAGSTTQPVYFANGVPVATTYTLGTSVPSGAKFTDTVYTHPEYTARTGKPTANATPGFGSTFTVSQITSDATGHVTGATDRTIKIPNTVATTSAAGLMAAADKTKLNATNMAYGTCSTAAATDAKVVTISGNTNWTLAAGSMVTVLFTETNTAENPTLNVNGTGAKNVFYGASQITTSNLGYAGTKDRPMTFIYDGTQYRFNGWGYDSNTTYTNVKLGHGYATCSTAAATVAKVGTLSSYTLTTGGIVSVKFTYDVPAKATLNINSKGAKSIYYRGAAIPAGVIKAGDVATFIYSSQYHLISIDRELDVIHPAVTAATAQGDASKTLTFGGTFAVPTITYDANGHVTGKGTNTMTMPSIDDYSLITREDVINICGNANIETWSFTLEDGTTVNKDVVVS